MVDLNTDTSVERTVPPPAETTRERPSVRDELRKSFADARRDDETREPEVEEEPVEEAAETEAATEAEPTERTTEARGTGESEDIEAEPSVRRETQAAPTAWSKEAKAAFTHLPEHVKKAVLKREGDVEKG